jgi:DNA-binding beta-propeller fold protein YncE
VGNVVGTFSKPKGITVDREGHIYVVDGLYDTVQVFNLQGELLMNFGSSGNEEGHFWLPIGIFADTKDRIYVADTYNHRVQVFEYLGQASGSASDGLGRGGIGGSPAPHGPPQINGTEEKK